MGKSGSGAPVVGFYLSSAASKGFDHVLSSVAIKDVSKGLSGFSNGVLFAPTWRALFSTCRWVWLDSRQVMHNKVCPIR